MDSMPSSQNCPCGKHKRYCKIHGGGAFCPCGRDKKYCKLHGGNSLCVHGKATCAQCRPSLICVHNKRKSNCAICYSNLNCTHGRSRYKCVVCRPSLACEHGRNKYECSICNTDKYATRCHHLTSKGTFKFKKTCPECDPLQHLRNKLRLRLKSGLRTQNLKKKAKTDEYLGASYGDVKHHLQKKMDLWNSIHDAEQHMTWGNTHVDHIKPLACANPEHPFHSPIEDLVHFTNLQPLLKRDNMQKHDRWNAESDRHWQHCIRGNASYLAVFM